MPGSNHRATSRYGVNTRRKTPSLRPLQLLSPLAPFTAKAAQWLQRRSCQLLPLPRRTQLAATLAGCAALMLQQPDAKAGGLFGLVGTPEVDISGYGWLGDLYLEHALTLISASDKEDASPEVNAVFIEDALWVLSGQLQQQGYLFPQITAIASDKDGAEIYRGVLGEQELVPSPPHDLLAAHVQFNINSGIRFYFENIAIDGQPADITREPASFFYSTDHLLNLRSNRFYTHARAMSGLQNAITSLRARGYRDARIVDHSAKIDRKNGSVYFSAKIDHGPVYYVRELTIVPDSADAAETILENIPLQSEIAAGERLTPDWLQLRIQQIRNSYYAHGHPEVRVSVKLEEISLPEAASTADTAELPKADISAQESAQGTTQQQAPQAAQTSSTAQASAAATAPAVPATAAAATAEAPLQGAQVTPPQSVEKRVVIRINGGPQVEIGSIHFQGEYGTSERVLKEQLAIAPGEELNRNRVEESRNRLSALGIFRSIDIDYREVSEHVWDITYKMAMKRRTAISLLMGVGSFDLVRGGVIVEQNNLFGLAHSQRLKAVQSIRSSEVDYRYGIPQLMGYNLDFYAKGNYLYRQQISFNRQEYGAATGLQHYYRPLKTSFDIQYSLEQLNARNRDFIVAPGPTQATVSAIGMRVSHSSVDNPVFPTKGWSAQAQADFAIAGLGGDVNYQRFEFGVAWHKPLTNYGLILHTHFSHGAIVTGGRAVEEIPVNRRFFMGGENTVRGFRRDQASPKNAQGKEIGAVSYVLGQIELEQRLTEELSIVTFVDAIGNAAEIKDYPFNETLISIGLGINYRTFVGPLRLEYGYNVKKRDDDPQGALQVSLGFPF